MEDVTIVEGLEDYTPAAPETHQTNGHHKKKEEERPLPEVFLANQLRTIRDEALKAMADADAHEPSVFAHIQGLSKVCCDVNGRPVIQAMGVSEVRNMLTDSANYYKLRRGRGEEEEEWVKIAAPPPKDLAELILALSPSDWPFQPLEAVVEVPVLRPDGTILDTPGYDAATRLYYSPSPDIEKCKVPLYPTKEQQKEAIDLFHLALGDFPYEGPADFANLLGGVFTPIVRPAVTGDVQMQALDANNPGVGKGTLAGFISVIATGKRASVLQAPSSDEEWDKRIISHLMSGATMMVIDNVHGTLHSAALEAVLTTREYEGRILGQSKMVRVVNRATWIVTGNNLTMSGDMARRCYRVRLVSPVSNPEERTDFKIEEDLLTWTEKHRAELIVAILTLARAWFVAGKPKPQHVPRLGTFTHWAQTIGGILEYAGIQGFQSNREELRAESNEESSQWDAFLHTWEDVFGSEWIAAPKLVKEVTREGSEKEPTANLLYETLPDFLKKALADKPHSFHVTLTKALGKRVKTAFGKDNIRIEREKNSHTKNMVWRVVRGVAVGHYPQTIEKNQENSIYTGGGVTQPPQPPANTIGEDASTGSTAGIERLFTPLEGPTANVYPPQNFSVGEWVNCPDGLIGQITRISDLAMEVDVLGTRKTYHGLLLASVTKRTQ